MSASRVVVFILILLVLAGIGAGGYYYWKTTQSTTTPIATTTPNPTPEYTASPSASLAPNADPMSRLKAGFNLLFAPPEYGYEATLSAEIATCKSTTFFDSRQYDSDRYDLVDTVSTEPCKTYALPTQFHETYRLPDKLLRRTSKQSPFSEIAKSEQNSLPPTSDAQIKYYLSSPENYTIVESQEVEAGLQIKARLSTDKLEGTYQFTIRPFNHRISQVIFSSTDKSTSVPTNFMGNFVFMNRSRVPTPRPELLK